MNSFELNKIAAATLIALLAGAVANQVSKLIIQRSEKKTKAFAVILPTSSVVLHSEKTNEPVADIKPFLERANLANGEKIFKKCAVCHNIGKGQPHKIGPSLWNVFMSPIARAADFAYSSALKEKKGNWDIDNLNHFLHNPKDFAPGTKMTFIGVAHDQDRADVIAYLKQHTEK